MNATSSIVLVAIVMVVVMIPAILMIVIAVRVVMMMVMMPPNVMVMVDQVICARSPRMSAMGHSHRFGSFGSMSGHWAIAVTRDGKVFTKPSTQIPLELVLRMNGVGGKPVKL